MSGSPTSAHSGSSGPSGLVVVDKPAGMTSHDVVARVRRLAGTRKVGHAGTLDPMATGVLVVGVERATRLLGHLVLTDKAYDATIRLGSTTTTDDAEGEVLTTADEASMAAVDASAVAAALERLVGEIDQVPSAVSAVKVGGRRAYDRVRAGEHVELAARRVRVHSIEVHEIRGSDVDVSVRCSSGTYVRAIARDLGASLGVGGHLTALRRTAVGPFDLTAARTLDQLAEDFSVVAMGAAARASFPVVVLDQEQADDVRVGRKLAVDLGHPGPVALLSAEEELLALYEQQGDLARAVAVFAARTS